MKFDHSFDPLHFRLLRLARSMVSLFFILNPKLAFLPLHDSADQLPHKEVSAEASQRENDHCKKQIAKIHLSILSVLRALPIGSCNPNVPHPGAAVKTKNKGRRN